MGGGLRTSTRGLRYLVEISQPKSMLYQISRDKRDPMAASAASSVVLPESDFLPAGGAGNNAAMPSTGDWVFRYLS